MEISDDLTTQLILNFFGSPFGIMFILGVLLNVAMIVAFFVTAYNVGKIRSDLNEWLELEHPTVEDDMSKPKR